MCLPATSRFSISWPVSLVPVAWLIPVHVQPRGAHGLPACSALNIQVWAVAAFSVARRLWCFEYPARSSVSVSLRLVESPYRYRMASRPARFLEQFRRPLLGGSGRVRSPAWPALFPGASRAAVGSTDLRSPGNSSLVQYNLSGTTRSAYPADFATLSR
jgi:hypothetical protein